MTLSIRDVEARLADSFPGSGVRVLDVDEVIEGQLVVALADLQADTVEPYLWVTVFQRASNGWFDILSAEGNDFVYSTTMGETIAVRSGVAPLGMKRCRVELFGEVRERYIMTDGYFLVAFVNVGQRDIGHVPNVEFFH